MLIYLYRLNISRKDIKFSILSNLKAAGYALRKKFHQHLLQFGRKIAELEK